MSERALPRPAWGERIVHLEGENRRINERQDAADKRVGGIESKVDDIHGVIMMFKGAKALLLGAVWALGSVAGAIAAIVTVARIWNGH